MGIKQIIFGWFNNQTVVNNNIVVDENYLKHLLTFQNNPSDINHVVLSLFNAITEDSSNNDKRNLPPDIDEKINFNNVISYRLTIENNFSENGFFLDSAYEALDSDTPGRRKLFLSYINTQYLLVLGDFIKQNPDQDKMQVIAYNSDTILTKMIDVMLLRLSNDVSMIEHLSQENITNCVIAIVCHAFVDCKVLENTYNQ